MRLIFRESDGLVLITAPSLPDIGYVATYSYRAMCVAFEIMIVTPYTGNQLMEKPRR